MSSEGPSKQRGKKTADPSETMPGYHTTLLALKKRKSHKPRNVGSPQKLGKHKQQIHASGRDALFSA